MYAAANGFALTRLLGFDLLPRLKRINVTKLYLPDADTRGQLADLAPVLSRRTPIRSELIADILAMVVAIGGVQGLGEVSER